MENGCDLLSFERKLVALAGLFCAVFSYNSTSLLTVIMANGSGKITAVQSGVLPVAGDMVVLITTRSSGRWIIPKGYIEKGMSPAESAAKEAWEEAGIVGKVASESIGSYSYRRPSGMFSVQVYPLEVESLLDQWEEMHLRERRVVTPGEAIDMVCNKQLAQIFSSFFNPSR